MCPNPQNTFMVANVVGKQEMSNAFVGRHPSNVLYARCQPSPETVSVGGSVVVVVVIMFLLTKSYRMLAGISYWFLQLLTKTNLSVIPSKVRRNNVIMKTTIACGQHIMIRIHNTRSRFIDSTEMLARGIIKAILRRFAAVRRSQCCYSLLAPDGISTSIQSAA